MAGAMGQLVVELQANTVQFNDALTKSAYQAAEHVQSIRTSMAGLESSVGSMVSTFSAFGSAVAGAFVGREVYDWAAAVVSAGEGLANLSNVTGSSVETLSRLQDIALVSGESFEDFRTVMGRLSVGLAAADSGSNKAGQALQFLGVTARDPAQALIEVAKDMDQYADGAGKAALARDLFGRGGEQFLATLHSIAQEQGIVNTFTAESAAQAQRLAESMRTLTVEGSAVKDAFLTSVVPALADVIQQYELARNAGLDFWSSLQTAGLDNNLAQLVPSIDAVKSAIDDSQKRLDAMREHQATYGEQSHALWQRDQEDILKTQQVIDDLTKKYQVMIEIRDKAILSRPGLSGPSTFDARDYQAQFKPQAGYDSGKGATMDNTFTNEVNTLTQALAKANIEKTKLLDPTPITATEQLFILFEHSVNWDKLTASQKNYVTQLETLTEAQERVNTITQTGMKIDTDYAAAQVKAANDEAQVWIDLGHKHTQAINDEITSEADLTHSLELRIATVGMSSIAQEQANALDRLAIANRQGLVQGYDAEVDSIKRLYAQLQVAEDQAKAAQEAEQQWKQAAGNIENDLMTAFDDWTKGAKNLGQQLRDELLKMFDTLILRPILAPIAGSIAGLAFPGVASASGAGGVLSDASSLTSLLGGGSGVGGIAGVADSAYSFLGLGSNVFSSGLADLSIAGSAGVAGVGGLGSFLSGVLPVIGPIAAIAALFAGGLFDSSHGPKTGGFGETGSDFGRFYTPSGSDSTVATLATTTLTSFNTLLSSLGGTGSANFAFGFDEDPNGTADSRVSAGATVNGKRVYDVLNQDAGRGDKGVQADLQLDAQRAILAALQASNLPTDIAHILDSIVPSSASADQIQQVEAMASAYGDLSKEISANPLSDALADLTAKAQGAYGAFLAEGTAYGSLLKTYDGSTAATQALDKASQDYYASLVALMEQIQQVKQSIDSMFGDDVRNFRLQSLDKQGQYAFYQSEAAADLKQIGTATDPTVVQTLEKQISDDLNAAFGLLDPTQQAAMLSKYISGAAAAQAAGDTRLTQLGANASTQFTDAAKQAQQALTDAATKMHDAAATIAAAGTTYGTAANTALRAAQTPVTLNVNVNGTTAAEVNIG